MERKRDSSKIPELAVPQRLASAWARRLIEGQCGILLEITQEIPVYPLDSATGSRWARPSEMTATDPGRETAGPP